MSNQVHGKNPVENMKKWNNQTKVNKVYVAVVVSQMNNNNFSEIKFPKLMPENFANSTIIYCFSVKVFRHLVKEISINILTLKFA